MRFKTFTTIIILLFFLIVGFICGTYLCKFYMKPAPGKQKICPANIIHTVAHKASAQKTRYHAVIEQNIDANTIAEGTYLIWTYVVVKDEKNYLMYVEYSRTVIVEKSNLEKEKKNEYDKAYLVYAVTQVKLDKKQNKGSK